MALITPIALTTPAFDATQEHTFYFQSNGGDQVTSNTITIVDNDTSKTFTNVSYYSNINTLPANTLTNGHNYTFHINTHNTIGGVTNTSQDSNSVLFYCYTTPQLSIADPTHGGILYSADYDFEVTYTQTEGELLKEAIGYLYDGDGDVIDTKKVDISDFISGVTKIVNFGGMIDGEQYSVNVKAITVNETIVESNRISFIVRYDSSSTYFNIKAENDCKNGRVIVTSNLSLIDGHSSSTPIFIDNNTKILLTSNDWVEWDENYSLYSNHLALLKWWTPVQLGKTMVFESTNGYNRIEFYLRRDYENVCDYVEAKVFEGDTLIADTESNRVPPLNNTSQLITYMHADDDNYEIQLNVLSQTTNKVESNTTNSNLQYNRLSDFQYSPTVQASSTNSGSTTLVVPNSDIGMGFQVKRIRVMNAIIDQMYISNNPSFQYTTTLPQWGVDTVLRPTFNGNILAGNVDFSINELDHLRIKRREKNTLKWSMIYQKKITTYSDLLITHFDSFVKSGKVYEYVVLPVLDEVEGNYNNITEVLTRFDGFFISDNSTNMVLYSGVTYPNRILNQEISILTPYGKKYPKIIHNGTSNYQSLSITGNILDPDNLSNLNRNNITREAIKWDKFLTNGKTKFIKDWNGNVWIASVTTPPSYSYSATNLIPSINFTVTEQGDYSDPNVYLENGLVTFE